MSNYLLKESTKIKKIENITLDNAYDITIKKEENIKKVTIYDQSIIQRLIIYKYTRYYQRILKIIKDLFASSDASESDYMLAMGEVYRLKDILYHKYKVYLKEKQYELFLEKLLYLDNILQEQILEYQRNNETSMKGR